jgi:hypothetical protein
MKRDDVSGPDYMGEYFESGYEAGIRGAPLLPVPEPLKLQFRSYGFVYEHTHVKRADSFDLDAPPDEVLQAPMEPGFAFCLRCQVTAPYRPKWLLVATPGFQIQRLTVDRVYMLLDDVDGDLYLTTVWDTITDVLQLERLRLPGHTIDRNGTLELQAKLRPGNVATRFSAMVVGEEAA